MNQVPPLDNYAELAYFSNASKGNPYHDKLGRFASKDGGSESSRQSTTYDYYKDSSTKDLYMGSKMYVEDDGGEKTVTVVVPQNIRDAYGYPSQVQKGVWSTSTSVGGEERFVPEGDPNYDEKGEQMAWGKRIVPYETWKRGRNEYDENGEPVGQVYSHKLIRESDSYWSKKYPDDKK